MDKTCEKNDPIAQRPTIIPQKKMRVKRFYGICRQAEPDEGGKENLNAERGWKPRLQDAPLYKPSPVSNKQASSLAPLTRGVGGFSLLEQTRLSVRNPSRKIRVPDKRSGVGNPAYKTHLFLQAKTLANKATSLQQQSDGIVSCLPGVRGRYPRAIRYPRVCLCSCTASR